MIMKPLWMMLAVLLIFTGTASAFTIKWNMGTEKDLAGYKIYLAPGTCAAPGKWIRVKTVGKVTQTSYTPTASGTFCFAVRSFDTSNNISKSSKLIQVKK
jgi:hypothetical protein